MKSITIKANGRIHSGLLNESGYMGRIDGGIGFSINLPSWEIVLSKTSLDDNISTLDSELSNELERLKAKLRRKYNLPDFYISLPKRIESHIGLGSKTALLMGFGMATSRLFGLELTQREIAIEAKRAGTSGIGYWAAHLGGFLWDAGRAYPNEKPTFMPSSCSQAEPPSLISSIDLHGYYICHFRYSTRGIHGDDELSIFRNYCPLPHESTKDMLSVVSGMLIPAILNSYNDGIQEGFDKIQDIGLKKIEWDHQDVETLKFRKYWKSLNTNVALCLSSMGPTMYCITKNPDKIKKFVDEYPVRPIHYQKADILNGVKL